jgi:hypothetical protein
MRVERPSGPPDLQAAFTSFVMAGLRGSALDDNRNEESAQGKFPDFACFRGLVLIEMKHLETDQHDRVNNILHAMIDPAEMPVFYASRDANHLINKASNADQVKAALTSKLSQTIESHLRKANRQFEEYQARHPRKNFVTICVILNSRLREFTPDLVLRAVHSKMKGVTLDTPRFPHIDGVLYISEKHYTRLPDGRMAFPVGIFEGVSVEAHPWKADLIDRIAQAWSRGRTGAAMASAGLGEHFDIIDDIPKIMPRHEHWRLEYRRRPYLRLAAVEHLKVIFNRCVAQGALAFLKGDWPKPSKEETMKQMRLFTHLIEETNERNLDLRAIHARTLSNERRREAYQGFPQELIDLLSPKTGDEPT